jgi:hypothetical protein
MLMFETLLETLADMPRPPQFAPKSENVEELIDIAESAHENWCGLTIFA